MDEYHTFKIRCPYIPPNVRWWYRAPHTVEGSQRGFRLRYALVNGNLGLAYVTILPNTRSYVFKIIVYVSELEVRVYQILAFMALAVTNGRSTDKRQYCALRS